MDSSKRVTIKLFMGCLLTAEVRLHLSQHADIPMGLERVHYHAKEYLGYYLPEEKIPLLSLKEIEQQLQAKLKACNPLLLPHENVQIFIFPHLFVI